MRTTANTWTRGSFTIIGGAPQGRTTATLRWAQQPRELYGLRRGRIGIALDFDGYRLHNLAAGMFICWARTLPAAVRLANTLTPYIPAGQFGTKPDTATQQAVMRLIDAAIVAAPADYAYIDAWTDRRYHCSFQEAQRRYMEATP